MSGRASEYERAALAQLARRVGVANAKNDHKAAQQTPPLPAGVTPTPRPTLPSLPAPVAPPPPSPSTLRALALDLLRHRRHLDDADLPDALAVVLRAARAAGMLDLARALDTITRQQPPNEWAVSLAEAALEVASHDDR